MTNGIITFTKTKLPFGWLSNMHATPVTFADKEWRTTEHLFQALRFAEDSPVREEIRNIKSPMAAKMHSKSKAAERVIVPMSTEDVNTMSWCLFLKTALHDNIKQMLLDTGEALLIEDVTKRPTSESNLFWGMALQEDGTWKGTNQLGKCWSFVRDSFRG
jgi:ribA/ribD-fused uncharacterized protein